jgi:RNA polymerase sigma-70 factor (ECF subfamily)
MLPLLSVDGVLERCADRLYGLALRITGTQEDAEAAIEDALRMMAHGEARGDASRLEASLYLGVAHTAHQRLRQRRRDVLPIAVEDVLPALDENGQHFEPMTDWSARVVEPRYSACQEALSAAIDALPADDRTALILHDIEAAPTGDIAEILGIDAQAVKLHVHRARLFVRKRLSAYFAGRDAA